MSLSALADALQADLAPLHKLVLITLANEADADYCVVPYFPRLAQRCGIGEDDLGEVLQSLKFVGILEQTQELDWFAQSAGFLIRRDRIPYLEDMPDSPWTKDLRVVGGNDG